MKTWQLLKENPSRFGTYYVREGVLGAIRAFFTSKGFHDVETPSLTGALPPESYIEVFETTLLDRNRKGVSAFMPTSPEPFLKKLLVAGIGNCFSICKSFRNTEDMSHTHTPEFTMLEWYRVQADYRDIMNDCEELMNYLHDSLQEKGYYKGRPYKKNTISYQGKSIDISAPWERVSLKEAFSKFADIDLDISLTLEGITKAAHEKGYDIAPNDTWEQIYNRIFLNKIEPHLGIGKPTILYDYPAQQAALSRKKKDDPRWAERFEIYIEGLELGDAYSELTDWQEQLQRFEQEAEERERLGKISHPTDMDFIEALKAGLPPSGGIAVGVDRLIMLFADTTSIEQTQFFPAKDLFEKEG